MKILVNAISAKRGGIVTYTENLIDSLSGNNVQARFAVPIEMAERIGKNTIGIRASDFGPFPRLIWEQTAWRRLVASETPDVLFSSANFGLINCPVPQVLLVREGGLFDPFYLTNMAPIQGTPTAFRRYFRRKLMLLSARQATHVITPSKAMLDALLLWVPEIENKCSVNHYGTLSDLYGPDTTPRPWRGDETLRLLYVSVYYPHKNPGVLCSATQQLNASGIRCRTTITMNLEEAEIPGGVLDRTLLARAADAGYVTLGHYPYLSLPDLYRSHDVFVFPSVSETFGHPMAEALGIGIPIVAADTSINREICGDAAIYFSPFKAGDLCEQVRRLDRSPDLRMSLKKAAVGRTRHFFDWGDHVARLIETFENVMHSTG